MAIFFASSVFTNCWLINIDFNDIETPNDIDEADELEATFTLENMELDNDVDNIDTSILILNDNDDEPAESDFVKINLKEDEIIETPKSW